MHGHEVGSLEQVAQAHELDIEQLGSLDRDDRVVGDDFHLESVSALGHLRADIAEPDHAQGLAADLGADELRASPLPALDRSVCLRHPARERDEQCDRVLRGGDDVAAWRVDHEDAPARRRRDVDVVHADACAPDDAELAPGFEDRRRHARLAPDHKRVVLRYALDELRLSQLADDRHLTCPPEPCQAALRQRIGDQDPGQLSGPRLAGRGGDTLQ